MSISYAILYTTSIYISDILLTFHPQVEKLVRSLKHKLQPECIFQSWRLRCNSFCSQLVPRRSSASFWLVFTASIVCLLQCMRSTKTLRNPNTIKGIDKNGAPIYIISKQRLNTVFSRLRNRLSSLDSSTSTIVFWGYNRNCLTLLQYAHQTAWWKAGVGSRWG